MYIVYKTTNQKTGQFYIGSHKLSELDKRKFYFGSGIELDEQFSAYPESVFVRDTLYECETSEEALKIEHEFVKQHRSDPLCLNRNNGGRNFEHINNVSGLNNSVNNCSLGGQRCSELRKEDPEFAKEFSQKIRAGLTPEIIARVAEHNKGNQYSLGYKHTDSAKSRIGSITSVAQKGKGNSQYGTYWITDGYTNKKWHDSKGTMPEGFYRGRVMK